MRVVSADFPPDTHVPIVDVDDPRLGMPERTLHEAVTELATHLGWSNYHTYNSRGSKGGFPDLVLWRRRIIFIELKSTKGKLRRDQDITLHELANSGATVHVWRPVDWITGVIEHELRRR